LGFVDLACGRDEALDVAVFRSQGFQDERFEEER
jgi:hypothetical protein